MTRKGIYRWLAGSALFVGGCSIPVESTGPLAQPDRETFPLVLDALDRRCGTLDCHGHKERNLRFYSGTGLRLDPGAVPGSGTTSAAEYDATYRSFVGLEPEVMGWVVAEGGRNPERLTLVRKARGSEDHKGGAALREGDAADRCLTSWLSPSIDEARCLESVPYLPPEPPGSDSP